jgi:hypothetical protein
MLLPKAMAYMVIAGGFIGRWIAVPVIGTKVAS